MARVTLIKKGFNPFEVVKLKITRDITKLVFDQIRINCIKKKKKKREYRTSCKTVLTTLTKPTRKTHTHTLILILSALHNRQICLKFK